MTFKYNNVYIKDTAVVAGKFEHEGPMSKYFQNYYAKEEKMLMTYSLHQTISNLKDIFQRMNYATKWIEQMCH